MAFEEARAPGAARTGALGFRCPRIRRRTGCDGGAADTSMMNIGDLTQALSNVVNADHASVMALTEIHQFCSLNFPTLRVVPG